MSVIIGMLSLVWGSYIVQPEWFDDGPYVEIRKGLSEGECKIDKKAKPATEGTLTYLDCDAWQGCYFKQ